MVLLDLDGTLIDPLVGITRSYQRAAVALRRTVPVADEVRAFIGPPIQDVFADRWGCGEDAVQVGVAAFRAYYSTEGIIEFDVYEGVDSMVSRLRRAGLRLALATSKPVPYAERIVEQAGWTHDLEVVAGADLAGKRRAKQAVIRYALDLLDVAPADCVMVGDRREDVLGASAVGIPTVGATWGHGTPEELVDAGVALLADSPGHCADILLSDGTATGRWTLRP